MVLLLWDCELVMGCVVWHHIYARTRGAPAMSLAALGDGEPLTHERTSSVFSVMAGWPHKPPTSPERWPVACLPNYTHSSSNKHKIMSFLGRTIEMAGFVVDVRNYFGRVQT